jgi:hypothetical protein
MKVEYADGTLHEIPSFIRDVCLADWMWLVWEQF